MNNAPSILFITRTYPPIRGGMEQLSYDITTEVGKLTRTKVITNRYGKKFLPIFFVTATIQGLFTAKNYDVVHIGDPVLCLIGWMIKKVTRKPVAVEVHGLDILYPSKIYQWYLKKFFSGTDLYICISNYVASLVNEKFPGNNTVVITPGIKDVFYEPSIKHDDLEKYLGSKITNKRILLTVGRLIKRKGVEWFITNVLPKLPENIIYVVIGNGPEKEKIDQAIKKTNQQNKVIFLHDVPREKVKLLYNTADLFIMPNIEVKNDAEGFGLVAVEAASCKLPIIAAKLEGITDAVIDDQNGILVESENADAFADKINSLLQNENVRKEFGKKAREFTMQNFAWPKIAQQYMDKFSEICELRRGNS